MIFLESKVKQLVNNFNLDIPQNYAYYGLHILYSEKGEGGIQGFMDTKFYIDQFGAIANSFYVISSQMGLISDSSVRPVLMDAKYINLVYPRLYS